MSDSPLEFISVVPTDTPLGRRLASFAPFGLDQLCSDFEVRFSTKVSIKERDRQMDVDRVVLEGVSWFEITFTPQRHDLLHEFEQLAFETGSPAQPE